MEIMERKILIKKTQALRAKGKTYSEIEKILNIKMSKGTLSYWCKGISLPGWYKKKIGVLNDKNIRRAQKIAWASNKAKRESFLKSVKIKSSGTIARLNKENLKIILAVLYLGEGAKWRGHAGLMLGSSDPAIIILYIKLLNRCYSITADRLKCRVSYRADQNIKKLESYWSKMTRIPLKNFYKTKPDPRTIGKKTLKKEYKGVCVITCRGTDIQLELEQIADLLAKKLRAHSSVG